MKKEEIKKRLIRFSKEDIIDCVIEDFYFYDNHRLNNFVSKLKGRQKLRKLEERDREFSRVSQEQGEAMNLYFDWRKQAIEKYGKDGQVRLVDIPLEEIQIGAKLEEDFNKKNQAYMKLLSKEAKV